ncbi:hypothetical protein HNP46_001396 [Pseudomonas nitritireducens]|uniref:DUF481 domain-containing protein n=1 Tax=Pseudomonas nitroreducens TaxID=46680 RepID=A0A7W7P0R6_PSENT|nr:hypothetical protein [Pseudomonas nitritireducens]MBB4862552.1 hypothetical protein [Pseudomonas nitritireducens]
MIGPSKRPFVLGCSALLMLLVHDTAYADVRAVVGAQLSFYRKSPQYPQQSDKRLQGAYNAKLSAGGKTAQDLFYDLELYGRHKPQAAHANTGDIRQATLSHNGERVEVTAGVLAETWGTLEAYNPVDVINQRDQEEDFRGKVKLGQPGAKATVRLDDDTQLTLYGTTYARERRYAEGGERNQLLPVEVRHSKFENGRMAPELAARLQHRATENLDVAASYFVGHSREPLLTPVIGARGLEGLDAYYEKMQQAAFEAQYVIGDSVLKAEAAHRAAESDQSWGGGVGMETTFSKLLGSVGDLTTYLELYGDNRSDKAPLTPLDHDLYAGLRYALNDPRGTVIELQFTHDLRWKSELIQLNASQRIFDDFVMTSTLLLPQRTQDDPALTGLARDAQLTFGLSWYR